jgi:hypothetical protein
MSIGKLTSLMWGWVPFFCSKRFGTRLGTFWNKYVATTLGGSTFRWWWDLACEEGRHLFARWWSSHNVGMARWHLNKDNSCIDTKQYVRLLKGFEVICMKWYIQISRGSLTIGFYKIHFNVVCAMINIANCTL